MKSKAPQLHLEYRFYKLLGSHGKYIAFTYTRFIKYGILKFLVEIHESKHKYTYLYKFFL